MALAGPVAAEMVALPGGYIDDASDLEAQAAADRLAALPAPLRDRLAESEAETTALPTDEAIASELKLGPARRALAIDPACRLAAGGHARAPRLPPSSGPGHR